MLPQFNTAFFPSQFFWLVICFGMFYFLVARFAMPRVAEILSERQRRIDDDLERAAQLNAQTEAAIRAYEQTLINARLQAHAVLQQSQNEIVHFVQSRNREVTAQLNAEVKAGEDRIAAAKQIVLGQVQEIATEVAETIIGHLVNLTLEKSSYQEVITAVVREHS